MLNKINNLDMDSNSKLKKATYSAVPNINIDNDPMERVVDIS